MKVLLEEYLKESNIKLSNEQIEKLLKFVSLLNRWNQTYNLTSVRDPKEMLSRHIMDSLVVGKYLKGNNFADVGSGPGLPGIPLAIMYPERNFTLIDSRMKRTVFQRQVVIDLKISNVKIVCDRVENLKDIKFDGIISRAFASLQTFADLCKHLASEDTFFYALKGKIDDPELNNLSCKTSQICQLNVPNCKNERNLVIFNF